MRHITNFDPRARAIYERAITHHPECLLVIGEASEHSRMDSLGLYREGEGTDLSDFWTTYRLISLAIFDSGDKDSPEGQYVQDLNRIHPRTYIKGLRELKDRIEQR